MAGACSPACGPKESRRSVEARGARALPSSLQREGLEQLRVYESEYERRCMVEYEYAMYAPYHPDLLVF